MSKFAFPNEMLGAKHLAFGALLATLLIQSSLQQGMALNVHICMQISDGVYVIVRVLEKAALCSLLEANAMQIEPVYSIFLRP
jgi:hypothetical protein